MFEYMDGIVDAVEEIGQAAVDVIALELLAIFSKLDKLEERGRENE